MTGINGHAHPRSTAWVLIAEDEDPLLTPLYRHKRLVRRLGHAMDGVRLLLILLRVFAREPGGMPGAATGGL